MIYRRLASALLALLLVVGFSSAHGAVIFNFAQVGPNVVATTSGSMFASSTGSLGSITSAGSNTALLHGGGNAYFTGGGTVVGSGLTATFNSSSGDIFGYTGGVYVTPVLNQTYSPATTFTWNNTTLDALFEPDLPSSMLVYTSPTGDQFYFVRVVAVPEPGRTLPLLAGLVGMLNLRRRRSS